ncbi:MAG: hypothetical protein ABI706_03175 [Ilumatobacteraceae bacterium]
MRTGWTEWYETTDDAMRAIVANLHIAHSWLLPMLGISLGELFDLSALAADCATDGRYACLFVSAPLNVPDRGRPDVGRA